MKIHPAAGGKGPWRRVGPARGLQRNHPRQQRSVMTTPSATIRRSISPRPGQTLPHTFEAPMKQVRRTLPRLLRLLALTALLGTGAAQADDYTEITQLIKAGKPADALAKADQRLAANPRDPQLRFLRGVAQADSGKPADAITTFTKLTASPAAPPPQHRQRPLPWWPRSGQRNPQQWPLPLHRPRQPPQHPSPHLRPLQLLRLLSPKPPPQHPQPPRQQQATPQPFRP